MCHLSNLFRVTSSPGLGKSHQTLIDAKARCNGGRDKTAAIAEVHREEMVLIHQYEAALPKAIHLNKKVRHVLQEQLKTIRKQDAAICVC